MDHIKDCLVRGDEINFFKFMRLLQETEEDEKLIFERNFVLLMEATATNDEDEDLRRWAKYVIDSNFKILRTVDLADYWNDLKLKKQLHVLRYQSQVDMERQVRQILQTRRR